MTYAYSPAQASPLPSFNCHTMYSFSAATKSLFFDSIFGRRLIKCYAVIGSVVHDNNGDQRNVRQTFFDKPYIFIYLNIVVLEIIMSPQLKWTRCVMTENRLSRNTTNFKNFYAQSHSAPKRLDLLKSTEK